jgi:hypothetical protein
MSAASKIEWTDATVNFWWGCTKVGPGCDHCYAEVWSRRMGGNHWGVGVPRWKIKSAVALIHRLDNGYADWAADYEVAAGNARAFGLPAPTFGPRRRVFIQSMSDLFDLEVSADWFAEAWAKIETCNRIDIQIVTKRLSAVTKRLSEVGERHLTLRRVGAMQIAIGIREDANLRVETRADLAERAHVSERSIASAAAVRDHGVPELQSAVKQAAIQISKAEHIARLPETEQREEVERALPNADRAIAPRRQEPADSLDFFPTPPWATRALMDVVMPELMVHTFGTAWEPACGEGHIADVLTEYFDGVLATDVHGYGYSPQIFNFIDGDLTDIPQCDWIITNPPFNDKAEQFVLRAISHAKVGVAMFLRLQWLEGQGRYERIFKPNPPTLIAQFAERVPLHKGRYEPDGVTLTAYLWMIWMPHAAARRGTRMFWIAPGQKAALTHPDDAARFTAHPVIRKSQFDPETGEIADDPVPPEMTEAELLRGLEDMGLVPPAAEQTVSPCSTGTMTAPQDAQPQCRPEPTCKECLQVHPEDIDLEIPDFLRRPREGEEGRM